MGSVHGISRPVEKPLFQGVGPFKAPVTNSLPSTLSQPEALAPEPQHLQSQVRFGGLKLDEQGKFEVGISSARLNDIVQNKMRELVLDVPASAFAQLSPQNQRALVHLVKAARHLDTAFLKQDHPDNLQARKLLEKAAAKGNPDAKNALILFNNHNGLEGFDMYAPKTKPLRLFKNLKLHPGKGFYPQDLTKKELANYLVAHPEQASAILSNNTVVQRKGQRLEAIPYSVAFRQEFEAAARELQAAARETDHKGLSEYLQWQAQALVNDSDAETLYNADKHWIGLEDAPLEFTIGRESYEDSFSSDVAADPRVEAVLKANGIKAKAKDSIGVRVGIVNQESVGEIADYRRHLKAFASEMPLADQYKQTLDGKMTFADVDLVTLTGDYAAVRGGITLAQNLPNDDKLAPQLGVGSRLVFHRQVRQGGDPAARQKFLDSLVEPEQHSWYDPDSDFLFTIGHELAHSLGPRKTADNRDKKAALGKFGDMLEENKADVASIVMTDYFVKIGKFTPEQANKIYLSWAADELPIKQPRLEEAHRSRSIMQLNYFREHGAIRFEKGGKLSIVPEKMGEVGRRMLEEVIQLQLAGDADKAEAFVKKYAAWNDALQYASDERMKMKPKLYRQLKQPFADALVAQSGAILSQGPKQAS